MIMYLGECAQCGQIDYWASVNDPAPTECPECKAKPFKRLIGGSGAFRLKGGGWADDGYEFASHPRFSPKEHQVERERN